MAVIDSNSQPQALPTDFDATANVVLLPKSPKVSERTAPQRLKIVEFKNRSGSQSWRVSGIKRDGGRIRENSNDLQTAQCRQLELESEYLRGQNETAVRATKLSQDQIQLAEVSFANLGEDWQRLLDAVSHWKQTGVKNQAMDAPRIDEAVQDYLVWLSAFPFRDATKKHWRTRMNGFKNSVQNIRVSEVTPEFIEKSLSGRNTSPGGKDTDKRAISRFFSWCIERPRRWATTNPCREVRIDQGEKEPPKILSLKDCKAVLHAAQKHKGGLLVPYVAVCLFGGLRPFESARLEWKSVNLKDNEIRLEANQTKTGRKTGRGRVVEICPTLKKWLKTCKNRTFYPANWRKEFDAVKLAAGFGTPDPKDEKRVELKPWPDDVLRHTAISHYFRLHKSYGKAAEQFGNSEAIIKKHYQSRVSSDDTKKFYALLPEKNNKTS